MKIETRKDLYEMIWREPMTSLSKKMGLSDKGLAKLCDRNDIPVPSRGHWAKVAAGKKIIQKPLKGDGSQIVDKDLLKSQQPDTHNNKPHPRSHVNSILSKVGAVQVKVSKTLRNPHPVVKSWQEKYSPRYSHLPNNMRPLHAQTLTPIDRRKYRILDALYKSLSHHGFTIASDSSIRESTATYSSAISISFTLTERYNQIRVPLTESDWQYQLDSSKKFKVEKQYNGNLMLNIKTWLPEGLTQKWAEDIHTESLEEMLPEIAKTLIAAAPIMEKNRKEELQRERRDIERRIAERDAKQKLERDKEMLGTFLDLAEQGRKIRRGRLLLKKVIYETSETEMDKQVAGKTVSEWLDWMNQMLNDYDPENFNAEGMLLEITKQE